MATQVIVTVRLDEGEIYGAVQDSQVQAGMDELADAALDLQRVLCPVDTGRMLRSLAIKKRGNGRDVGSFGLKYPRYVEEGHHTRGGTWVPPQPFIRPSLDAVRRRLNNG